MVHTPVSHGESTYSVNIELFYDILANTGLMEIRVHISDSSSVTMLEIPLTFLGERVGVLVINVSASPETGSLIYEHDEYSRVLKVITSNVTRVSAWFTVENIAENYAPGIYGFFLSLVEFANASSLRFSMNVYGSYDITVENLLDRAYNGTAYFSNPFTLLILDRPSLYFILITMRIEEQTPNQPSPLLSNYFLLIGTIIGVGVAGSLLFLWWRRRASLELEAVAARDLLNDEVARDIILALGRAGDKSLQQSELVNITGRPKSSVSRRIKKLEEEGYVNVVRAGKYNYLRLTDKGYEAFRKVASKEKKNE
ncbi:helix-turn-helix transcriptional regulator [Thermosphaera aggregans]|uniref:helix-turn-helix transcriptional regulator n=1 Tax=Thermosphaera aggregans TaxID=54254 RepID=UPI003C71F8E7